MAKIIGFDACDKSYYALRDDGEVIAWSSTGIVPEPPADGTAPAYRYMPTDMGKVKQILCMPKTVFAIDSSGSVRGWGSPDGTLLDIPEGLKAKAIFSSCRSCVAAIKLDNSVVVWGNPVVGEDGVSVFAVPAGLTAKHVALYDTFALAINMENKVVAWGKLVDGFAIPADLGDVKTVCSTGKTAVAIKDTDYAVSWKAPSFAGVPVLPPLFNFSKVKGVDSFNNYYGIINNQNKLTAWTFNGGDLITNLYSEVSNVSSFRCAKIGADGAPKYCIIHKTGLVSILGGKTADRKIPSSVAHYAAQNSMVVTLVNPSTPTAAAQGPVGPGVADGANGADEGSENGSDNGSAHADIEPTYIFNPEPAEKPIILKSVSLGSEHACALTEDGSIICWGAYIPPEVLAPRNVKEVFCGLNSVHFISSDNSVTISSQADGLRRLDVSVKHIYNSADDEGIYVDFNDNHIVSYTGELRNVAPAFSAGYIKVEKQPFFTMCLSKENKIKIYARAGDIEHVPNPSDEMKTKSFIDFSSGHRSCLAIDMEGNLYGWAKNVGLAEGAPIPDVLPEGVKKAKFVASYGNRHAIIKPDNTIAVWTYGEDNMVVVDESLPKRIRAKFITINNFGVAVITSLGKVVVFSEKDTLKAVPANILGNAEEDACRYLPPLPLTTVLQIATGKGFTLALRNNTTIVGWGDRANAVLEIPAITAKYVCAGEGVAGAIKMDDSFVSWGTGFIGAGELDGRRVKKVVLHKSGMALTLTGEVVLFGLDPSLREIYAVPAGLAGVHNIDFIEYDDKKRYVAIKSDLTVAAWGDDVIPVSGQAVRAVVGRKAILVVRKNGKVEGFGDNSLNELEIPGQLRAKEIYAGDACLGVSAINGSFGEWGVPSDETEGYQNAVNWIPKGFAFGTMNKRVACLFYTGYHFAAVNLDGQIVLWGSSDHGECDVPNIIKNVAKPIGLGAPVSSLALTWNYGAAVVGGSVKVWGGLQEAAAKRLENLPHASADAGVKQVIVAGNMWLALLDSGTVLFWNSVDGLTTGTEPNIMTITSNDDYDKISASQNIVVGLVKGTGKVRAYGKKGFSIQKIPTSIKPGHVKDIFAGPTCAMAIGQDDMLVVWGKKYDACLNPPADLGPIRKVMCTDVFALAIKMDGSLRLWGGLSAAAFTRELQLLPSGNFKDIFMTPTHYLGIKDDDTVVEWGGKHLVVENVMPDGLKAKAIFTSGVSGFSAAVNLEGDLVVWGGSRRVGQNEPLDCLVTPEDVAAVAAPAVKKYVAAKNVSVTTVVESETAVMSIVSGPKQVGIIDATGHVVTWGQNDHNLHFIPRHLEGVDFLSIGPDCCVARNSLGQYVFWGEVAPGSGLNELPDELDCKKMVLTDCIGLAINEDNTLIKWGRTPGVAEGRDDADLPEGLRKVRDVAACGFLHIAADDEGKMHLWGEGEPVIHEPEKKALAVAVGKRHYCAILEDTSVISWGLSNEYKQQDVPDGLKAKQIACGFHFTAAIDMEDNVVAWGFPKACTEVPAGLKAVSISCGFKHVVALKADGKYVIWGHNVYNTVQLAPAVAFLDPSVSLAQVSRYDFRRDFDVRTKYMLNRRQVKEIARNDKVFDMVLHKEGRKLVDFLIEHQGNAVIFRYNGEQTATLKSAIEAGFKEKGDSYRVNVFYECKGRHVMEDALIGTFEFEDIYKKPYYQLNLGNGTFLITMDDLERIFKQNQFWILQDTGIELKYTASYWSVVAGGPLVSANHCQDGTDKKLFMLVPFSIISDEEEEEVAVDQTVITVKAGEESTNIDISDSKLVADVKAKFAALKEVSVDRIRFVSAGKLLKDTDSVVPGFVVQALIAAVDGGDGLKLKRVRKTRRA